MPNDFEIQKRLVFMQVVPETKLHLRRAWSMLKPRLAEIVDDFYAHLKTDSEVSAILGGHADRLKSLQVAHWERLFSRRFDDTYMRGVYTVGMVHKRIGLKPRWYIAGYRLILSRITTVIARRAPTRACAA